MTPPGVVIRRWGFWTFACWVDGTFVGTESTRDAAQRLGSATQRGRNRCDATENTAPDAGVERLSMRDLERPGRASNSSRPTAFTSAAPEGAV